MSQSNYHESTRQDGQVVSDTRVREHRAILSPARIVGGIAGVILTVIGIVAIIDAGLDGSLNEPVVEVIGLDMSAAVGIGFLVIGLLLLLAAATYGGGAAVGFFGVLLLLFGVFAVAISDDVRADVGVGRDVGWFSIIGRRNLSGSIVPPLPYLRSSSGATGERCPACDPLLNDATESR